MALRKDVSVAIEIEYYDPEDEDKWVGSTIFRTEKKGNNDLEVESFKPNIGKAPLLDLIDEMDAVAVESLKKLHEYKDPEKAFGIPKESI